MSDTAVSTGKDIVSRGGERAVALYSPPARASEPESLAEAIARPAWAGAVLMGLFLGGLALWGALAPIAGGAVAPGVISPDGSKKTVQHLEGGIVETLHVRDGDAVAAGQPLIDLQSVSARATYDMLIHQRMTLLATRARLDAEAAGEDRIAFPEDLAKADPEIRAAVRAQQRLFETSRTTHEARSRVLIQRVSQLKEQIKGYEAQVASAKEQMALFKDELAGKKQLYDKGLLRKPELRHLERQYAEIEGRHGEYQAAIARARQQIGETHLQVLTLDAERDDRIAKERDEVRVKLSEVEERLQASRDILERTIVRAPVAGTIVNLRFKGQGAVIKPGEPIMEVVPSEDKLVIEARISPLDIDVVHTGVAAKVHLTAFSSRGTPEVPGVVKTVSADAMMEEGGTQPHYLARVEVDRGELAKVAPDVTLVPGMPVDVLIVTTERTMLEYLFQPILDALRRSFRET